MKKIKKSLLIVCVGLLLLVPLNSKAGQVQDVIDHFLAAISTQLPDPGMASILSAAPSAIKSSQMKKCEVRMQGIVLELDTHPSPERVAELEDALDRNQAIFNALNGNPESLKRYTEFKRKREKERRLKKQKEETAEEKDNLEWQLADFQKRIDQWMKKSQQFTKTQKEALAQFEENIDYFAEKKYSLTRYEAGLKAAVDRGKELCPKIKKRQQKIAELNGAVLDGEKLVAARISAAKKKALACETDQDAATVKESYTSAKIAFSVMKKALDGIRENQIELTIDRDQLSEINNIIKKMHSGELWKESRQGYENRLEQSKQLILSLEQLLNKVKTLKNERQKLISDLKKSREYYEPLFSGSKGKYDQIEGKINAMLSPTPLTSTDIFKFEGRLLQYQNPGFVAYNPRSDIYFGTPPIVKCMEKDSSQSYFETSEDAFLRSYGLIKSSEYLSQGCKGKDKADDSTEDKNSSQESQESTVEMDESDTQADETPVEAIGGLRIAGPTTIYVDKRAAFTATDAAGNPYPSDSGGFVWKTTMESLMTIASSGNPAGASAFKPGSCMLLLKYEGMTAWLDVIIKPAEENKESSNEANDEQQSSSQGEEEAQEEADGTESLFSMEGGETVENSTESESLFNMEGGETVAEIGSDGNNSGQTITLLGETTNGSEDKPKPPANKKNKQQEGKPRFEVQYWGKNGTLSNHQGIFDRYYPITVKLLNVQEETVINNKAHLVMKINGRKHYLYYYDVRKKAFHGTHYLNAGDRTCTYEVYSPQLPFVARTTVKLTVQQVSADKKKNWTKQGDLNRVNQNLKSYKDAIAQRRKPSVVASRLQGYASSLQDVARSRAQFGDYASARKYIEASVNAFEKLPNLEKRAAWDRIQAYFTYAQILLEGYDDRKGYQKWRANGCKYMIERYERGALTKPHYSVQLNLMMTANQLLTIGFDKSVAKPFYDAGMKYWTMQYSGRSRATFLNYHGNENEYNEWNQHSNHHNCAALFVVRRL